MSLPEPLTPIDCDLRGLPFMPLHGDRLIDSDLFFESTGEEFKAAVALWWASWKQVPAASLPDNPRVLAGLARVADAKRWTKVQERALHGWVRCSDGRLYHPVVADLANEAWADRQEHRAGKDAERDRKKAEREERGRMFAALKAVGVHLAWNVPMADLRATHASKCPEPVQDLSAGQVSDRPAPVTAIEGTVEGTGNKKEEIVPTASPPATQSRQRGRDYSPEFEIAWKAYPHFAGRSSKPDSAVEWGRLPAGEKAALLGAIAKFRPNVDAVCGGKGAPDMARWLKHGKHLSWMDQAVVGEDWPESRWAVAVGLWRSEGAWSENLGPPPGQPGCRVPSHLLIQPTQGSAA